MKLIEKIELHRLGALLGIYSKEELVIWLDTMMEGLVMSFLAGDKLEEIREELISLGYNPSDIKKIGPKPAHFTVSDPDNITIEFSEK
ncbi:hypothetical protein SAMN04487886_11762 [Clostridium sp. DSM 8431]|uniref:hypothetical protein n=1 Tax=Clostridium sp. DSM 8431 TaxID=1761781 RepID=UPI0008EC325A|nr:hypothetical protein [Clostridium sp. DSM 8431]SFU80495.1 hypothetical protein SAMN04487886_11762 [Clostridium sp. DSM 8431]